jgi:hypothetical protein
MGSHSGTHLEAVSCSKGTDSVEAAHLLEPMHSALEAQGRAANTREVDNRPSHHPMRGVTDEEAILLCLQERQAQSSFITLHRGALALGRGFELTCFPVCV